MTLAGVIAAVAVVSHPSGHVSTTAGTAAPSAQQASSLPGVHAPDSLAPCFSATATNCDKSKLPANPRASSACRGKGPRLITASPIAINDLAYIQPMGLMIGGHVTPIDHGYFYVKGAVANPPQQAPVYAPLDGNVSSVTRTVRSSSPGARTYDDYAITIEATCTFRVRFSNMVRFAGGMGGQVGQLAADQTATPNYEVKAGELIGYTGLPTAYGIDVWVEDDDVHLAGFVDPAQYTAAEAWKTHMAGLFDNTQEPLTSQLLGLLEKDASPRWGKIDYDIDGKLVGNWFRVGSGGYAGTQHGREGYWDGHLAVVYNGNDPSQIEVSFGNYQGQPQQFAVIGNRPDPATVGQGTAMVKYELGQIESYSASTGLPWDGRSYMPNLRTRPGTQVMGTVLLQLVGPRSLRVEILPGRTASQVSGFDGGAQMYER